MDQDKEKEEIHNRDLVLGLVTSVIGGRVSYEGSLGWVTMVDHRIRFYFQGLQGSFLNLMFGCPGVTSHLHLLRTVNRDNRLYTINEKN